MNHLIFVSVLVQVGFLVCYLNAEVEMHSEDPVDLQIQFESFKKKYGKSYINKSYEQLKFATFINHTKLINSHNKAFKNGSQSYYLALNHHSDKSLAEFKSWLSNGIKKENLQKVLIESERSQRQITTASVDYRTQIPAIKNQQTCGSCWAFATANTLEHQYYKAKGNVISFSEEEIADCTYLGYNGCNGGWVSTALLGLQTKGIESDLDYPYGSYPIPATAVTGSCKYNSTNAYARVTNVFQATPGSENSVKTVLTTKGVVAVVVDASTFQFYGGGIFTGAGCSNSPNSGNHAVTLVGYNSTYFILRNSWSTEWGEQGYMRIASGQNLCGLANYVYYSSIIALK